ncbi:phage tail protein [Pedobacter psychrophilus]|uniref:Phage tail protein n=1 Tax=Pedobacter psychrophilus TaxID=1826909 RepID=A0A179DKS0_9SPHI|nr:phage tail protein [Pedobacter psychrophilus]OAQ41697.1 phage tail protein [Pedobacter psychrophilus]
MPYDGTTQDTIWPLPKFNFSVIICGQVVPFQEVSGLETEAQIIEYRAGNSKQFSTVKMPGIAKYKNVTLKKGIFLRDNKFFDWFNSITMNTLKRETITIQLLDQTGNPTMTWTLLNAWPTKISGTDLKSDGNEVAVETIEIAHEGITIANS